MTVLVRFTTDDLTLAIPSSSSVLVGLRVEEDDGEVGVGTVPYVRDMIESMDERGEVVGIGL